MKINNIHNIFSENTNGSRYNVRKWLHIKKIKNRKYLAETVSDNDYTKDLGLLVNLPEHIKSLLHKLAQAPRAISLYVNSNRIEFISFNQHGAILLSGKSLKFVKQFIYLGSNISPTKRILTYE